ncbi:MAG: hypothetical protein QG657_3145 [Acidobacteriota bacterium]|nr:hypothetical protein [Acidobacteriota bacterium]
MYITLIQMSSFCLFFPYFPGEKKEPREKLPSSYDFFCLSYALFDPPYPMGRCFSLMGRYFLAMGTYFSIMGRYIYCNGKIYFSYGKILFSNGNVVFQVKKGVK